MLTDDYLESMTEYSDAVQVIVGDYDGSIRVFNLDHAKVVLRYVNQANESYAYHSQNIKDTAAFRPYTDDHLELVITTQELIVLESD